MNINDMTIGQARELAQLFCKEGAKPVGTNAAPAALEQAVVVCTAKNGVFFGYTTEVGPTIKLRSARNAYYWKCDGGVLELGSKGPQTGSKIGERADITLAEVTCVISCTPAAVAAWEAGIWVK